MADELGLLLSMSNNTRKKREIKQRTHPLEEYDDKEFKKRFRLSKSTVHKLLEEVNIIIDIYRRQYCTIIYP